MSENNKELSFEDRLRYADLIARYYGNKYREKEIIYDFDLILEKCKDLDFDTKDIIYLIKQFNDRNMDIYKEYEFLPPGDEKAEEDADLGSSEELIDISSLEETNLDVSEVVSFLSEYGISFNKKHLNKLALYGDFDKMRDILEFLKKYRLDFIFDSSKEDILFNTLLVSSVDLIKDLYDKVSKYGGDPAQFFRKNCTSLYPATYERGKKDSFNIKVTGTLNYSNDLMDYFKDCGYDVSQIVLHSSSIFSYKPSTVKEVSSILSEYNISLKTFNGDLKRGVSALKNRNIDNLDIAVESGCLGYFNDNISKIFIKDDNIVNLYMHKFLGKIGKKFFQFKNGSYRIADVSDRENYANLYGSTTDDLFKFYGAVSYDSPNKDLYDEILSKKNNLVISDGISENEYIKGFDELYIEPSNPLVYKFGNAVISRNKVLRLYGNLVSDSRVTDSYDALMYVATFKSMLDRYEFDDVQNCISSLIYERGNVYV